MKTIISLSNDADSEKLVELLGLNLDYHRRAAQSVEYVFKYHHATISQIRDMANLVYETYGDRCVGAFPSGDKFVVLLKTGLKLVSASSEKPAKLKITDEDYEALERAVLPVLKHQPKSYNEYKAKGLTDARFCFDLLHASKFNTAPLYKYLNDAQVGNALASILKSAGVI